MTEPSQYFKGRTVQEQMNEVIGYVDQRSAEVAVEAIASDVAQVHQDMLDADADAAAAAASAAAAAGTLANAVKKTGETSQSIAGDIAVAGDLSAGGDLAVAGDISGGTVTVPTPVNNTDAASKKYVDDALDNYAPMVRTTGNQTIAGIKTFDSIITPNQIIGLSVSQGSTDANSAKWHKFFSWSASSSTANQTLKFGVVSRQMTNGYSEVLINVRGATTTAKMIIAGTGAPASLFRITRDDDVMTLWIYGYRTTAWLDFNLRATSGALVGVAVTAEDPTIDYEEPTTVPTDPNPHTEVYTPS